jgi:hypothetical protein
MAKVVRNVTSILAKVDLDGLADALILDADADTHISAPTDDQIDFACSGTDVMRLTATNDAVRNTNNQVRGLTVSTISTAGADTWTIAKMRGGLILRDCNGANRSDVTPTAAAIVGGVPNAAVNDTFLVHVINITGAAYTVTVTAGANVTLVPATVTIAQNENATLLVRLTNVTGASETVTIYSMVAGG